MFTKFSDRMNFYERFLNIFGTLPFILMSELYFVPRLEKVSKKYFPNAPHISEVERNISLILSNGHFTTNYPSPLMPDVIDIGGLHCKDAKPLPKHLDDFLTGSGEEGFIYFSLGSIVKGSTMPDHIRKAFLRAFSKLKQRVLWKWETEEMDDLPANVMLGKWIPQQDVLGHPNIKIFITHGGLLSKQEALYHGVPVVGIALFGDQFANIQHSVNSGTSLALDILEINEDVISKLINRLLTEPQFSERAKSLGEITRDQPETPLKRAIFWTEYVIRHKGAHHIRSPARELNFFQYHSIDVIAALLAVILIVLYLVGKIVIICLTKLFRSDVKNTKLKHK